MPNIAKSKTRSHIIKILELPKNASDWEIIATLVDVVSKLQVTYEKHINEACELCDSVLATNKRTLGNYTRLLKLHYGKATYMRAKGKVK